MQPRGILVLLTLVCSQALLNAQLVINTVAGGYIPNSVAATSASIAVVGSSIRA